MVLEIEISGVFGSKYRESTVGADLTPLRVHHVLRCSLRLLNGEILFLTSQISHQYRIANRSLRNLDLYTARAMPLPRQRQQSSRVGLVELRSFTALMGQLGLGSKPG